MWPPLFFKPNLFQTKSLSYQNYHSFRGGSLRLPLYVAKVGKKTDCKYNFLVNGYQKLCMTIFL